MPTITINLTREQEIEIQNLAISGQTREEVVEALIADALAMKAQLGWEAEAVLNALDGCEARPGEVVHSRQLYNVWLRLAGAKPNEALVKGFNELQAKGLLEPGDEAMLTELGYRKMIQ